MSSKDMTSSGKVLECGGLQDVRLQFKNIKVAALPNKGLFQKEPYLSFEVEGGTKGRTLPAPNAEAPFWAEGVAILVPAHSKKNLVITVHNKHNILLPDTFVGQVSVPLNQIEAGGSLQHYPLHNKKDEQSGDISLEMQVLPPGEGGTTQQEGGPDAAAPADPAVSPAAGTAGMSGGGASQINRDVGPNSGTMPDPHGPGKVPVKSPSVGLSSASPESGSAGFAGNGATLINNPTSKATGTMADPHGPGTVPVSPPVVGSVPQSSPSGSGAYASSGATLINDDVLRGGSMADPHGPGKTAVSAPIVGGLPGSTTSGSSGYGTSGASLINSNVGRGPGTMADPHGPGKTAVSAPLVGGLPSSTNPAPSGYGTSGASFINTDTAKGPGTMADPHGPGKTGVSAPIIGGLPTPKSDASGSSATNISDPAAGSGTMPNPHGPGTANVSGPEGL